MALRNRGGYWFGENSADIYGEISRYSQLLGYPAKHFAEAICECGMKVFQLSLDDVQGAAVRNCMACGKEHPIGDSADYLEEADLETCACPCGQASFEIALGVSLYDASEDVRWLYLGCRCSVCGLIAVYGDWKNEFVGYKELLARV